MILALESGLDMLLEWLPGFEWLLSTSYYSELLFTIEHKFKIKTLSKKLLAVTVVSGINNPPLFTVKV